MYVIFSLGTLLDLTMNKLPNVETVLKRVADILKPGGIIILEDPDDEGIDENNDMQGLAGRSPLVSELHKLIRQRGANPCIGRDHARMLTALECFYEVHTRKLNLPLTRTEDSSIGSHSLLSNFLRTDDLC
jgi:SAM-dependent methyltransferase